jgi:hypothetical protein
MSKLYRNTTQSATPNNQEAEQGRRGPVAPGRKTHLTEAQPSLPNWPMTVCGHPVGRVAIAKKGESPTCSVCLRKQRGGRA